MSKRKTVDKQKVARSFLRGKDTYDENARIQKRVSDKLIDKLDQYGNDRFESVLEIGCCTGTLSELLASKFSISTLYLNDLVSSFLPVVREKLAPHENLELVPMFGDIEQLSLPDNLDLVISSATFQWLEDIDALFSKVYRALKPGGLFAFSVFGPGTLREFREVTDIGLEYYSIGSLLDMLELNFFIEEEETDKDQIFFSDPRDVLRHLQATGVGGVKEFRWTPGKIKKFEQIYMEKFGADEGVPVTYISSYIVCSAKG